MKIIPEQKKKDRWDELLEKTIHHGHEDIRRNDEFAFFDDSDDQVFMDDEKLVVVADNRHYQNGNGDMLKQILDKEFHPKTEIEVTPRTIQKPPRKSLSNRNSLERKRTSNSYSSSHSSVRFDD